MGRFVCHGVVVEEPSRMTLNNGLSCVRLLVEETSVNAYKETTNIYSVDFVGKASTCVPLNIRLTGAVVVIYGSLTSREFKGKYYNDLRGEQLTVVTASSFKEKEMPKQEDIDEAKELPEPDVPQLPADDLPF